MVKKLITQFPVDCAQLNDRALNLVRSLFDKITGMVNDKKITPMNFTAICYSGTG